MGTARVRKWVIVPNRYNGKGVPIFDLILDNRGKVEVQARQITMAECWKKIIREAVHGDEVEKIWGIPPDWKMSLDQFRAHGLDIGLDQEGT